MMMFILRDGRNYGYKYTCPECTSQYIATHDEEHQTSNGSIYTACPICGKEIVRADTSKDVDCTKLVELKKRLEKIEKRD